jgi:hypothetical protein
MVKAFGAARVECSTTKDKFETSPFKPGGTASAALGEMVVCSQRDPGDTTATKQEQCIQYADDELRPYVLDPHKQTLIDLQYYVQELQQEGKEVIIFLDASQDDQ